MDRTDLKSYLLRNRTIQARQFTGEIFPPIELGADGRYTIFNEWSGLEQINDVELGDWVTFDDELPVVMSDKDFRERCHVNS